MAPAGVIAMQITAAISMLATTYIILAIVKMKLTSKLFMKLVLFIAISDFGSAVCLVFGGTRSKSVECFLQGIGNNYLLV